LPLALRDQQSEIGLFDITCYLGERQPRFAAGDPLVRAGNLQHLPQLEQRGEGLHHIGAHHGLVPVEHRDRECCGGAEDRPTELNQLAEEFIEVKIGESGTDFGQEIRLHAQPVLFGCFNAKLGELEDGICRNGRLLLRLVQRNSARTAAVNKTRGLRYGVLAHRHR
jgi:hypothetical protein